MVFHAYSMGLGGIEGFRVVAECCITQGLPAFDIVGLPDAAVKESRERVRAAALSSSLVFPTGRITALGRNNNNTCIHNTHGLHDLACEVKITGVVQNIDPQQELLRPEAYRRS